MRSLRTAAAALLLATALGGCANLQTATAVNTGGAVAGPCTSCVIVDGGLYASIGLSAAVSNAIVYGMFGAMFFYDGLNWRPPPAMDENRIVHEQDCTKPLENPKANLKCKMPESSGARP